MWVRWKNLWVLCITNVSNSWFFLNVNLSSGFGMTFLISISLMAAALSCSDKGWDFDEAGKVAMLSLLSTSTVATLSSLSPPPIGSLNDQLIDCSNFCLGIFTNFLHTRSPQKDFTFLCIFHNKRTLFIPRNFHSFRLITFTKFLLLFVGVTPSELNFFTGSRKKHLALLSREESTNCNKKAINFHYNEENKTVIVYDY